MTKVAVVDYGVGNLLSVRRALEHFDADVCISANAEEILAADRVLLPGVGSFGAGMQALHASGLDDVMHAVAASGKPLLGICLGMQLLLDESEEFGLTRGLGLIPGRVVQIPSVTLDGGANKIPHIGWNALQPGTRSNGWEHGLMATTTPGDAVYFVHSFMAAGVAPEDTIAHCYYGGHPIPAVIGRGNVIGCQFHPEKSGAVGLNVLERFLTSAAPR